jgi:hypothetical protein
MVASAVSQVLLWVLVAFGVFVVVRLIRSWLIAGQRWGGDPPSPPAADLDEDVRQADRLPQDHEGR